MQKQEVRHTLHLETPAPGRYRQIVVVEQAGQFELLIFEDTFLRSDQLTSVGRQDWISARFYPTRDVVDAAADEEMRKSVAAGWILVQSVEP
jgi:hypothetical protein